MVMMNPHMLVNDEHSIQRSQTPLIKENQNFFSISNLIMFANAKFNYHFHFHF